MSNIRPELASGPTRQQKRSTAPWSSGNPRPPAMIRHDTLCLATYAETHVGTSQPRPGLPLADLPAPIEDQTLVYCWCLCEACWKKEGTTRDGRPKGRCICRLCPCH